VTVRFANAQGLLPTLELAVSATMPQNSSDVRTSHLPAGSPTARSHADSTSTRPAVTRGSVLIVDDDPIMLEATRERLERLNYRVFTREDALGTSQWAAEFQPDVILLDINMPALAGTHLAQILKKNEATKAAIIILHSASEPAQAAALLTATGAAGIISKTGDAQRFVREFENLVGRARRSG
jgi:two-component system OmpR family response regulator